MNKHLVALGIFEAGTRTLKCARQMNSNEMSRCNVPKPIIPNYILGHVTVEGDGRDNDKRVTDYAYSVRHSIRDVCKILFIFESGFTISWNDAHDAVGFDEFEHFMIKNMPASIRMGYADEIEKADMRMQESGYNDYVESNLAADNDGVVFLKSSGPRMLIGPIYDRTSQKPDPTTRDIMPHPVSLPAAVPPRDNMPHPVSLAAAARPPMQHRSDEFRHMLASAAAQAAAKPAAESYATAFLS